MEDPIRQVEEPVRDAPAPFSMAVVMFAVPAIVVAAWLLLPSTAAGVAVLVVIALAAVFVGIWRVLSLRRLSDPPPPRRPITPPSAH